MVVLYKIFLDTPTTTLVSIPDSCKHWIKFPKYFFHFVAYIRKMWYGHVVCLQDTQSFTNELNDRPKYKLTAILLYKYFGLIKILLYIQSFVHQPLPQLLAIPVSFLITTEVVNAMHALTRYFLHVRYCIGYFI